MRCIGSRVPTRVGQPHEGQGGRTAGVLVYIEDAAAADRHSGWSAPVGASLIRWGEVRRDNLAQGRGAKRGAARTVAAGKLHIGLHTLASRAAMTWPANRCRRHRRGRYTSKAQFLGALSLRPLGLSGSFSILFKSQFPNSPVPPFASTRVHPLSLGIKNTEAANTLRR
jgi:hypothetical protein